MCGTRAWNDVQLTSYVRLFLEVPWCDFFKLSMLWWGVVCWHWVSGSTSVLPTPPRSRGWKVKNYVSHSAFTPGGVLPIRCRFGKWRCKRHLLAVRVATGQVHKVGVSVVARIWIQENSQQPLHPWAALGGVVVLTGTVATSQPSEETLAAILTQVLHDCTLPRGRSELGNTHNRSKNDQRFMLLHSGWWEYGRLLWLFSRGRDRQQQDWSQETHSECWCHNPKLPWQPHCSRVFLS